MTITQEQLRAIFSYNAETGELVWKERPKSYFKAARFWAMWNTRFAGKIAGTIGSDGYCGIKIGRRGYRAHRLIWVLHKGEWPAHPASEIDHINGDRSDNRIENLRAVTKSVNQRNAAARSDNTSGMPGVSWCVASRKWLVRIGGDGRGRHLGLFADIEGAKAARAAAEIELGFHPNHGRPNRYRGAAA